MLIGSTSEVHDRRSRERTCLMRTEDVRAAHDQPMSVSIEKLDDDGALMKC